MIDSTHPHAFRHRHGMTLIEMAVALTTLSAAMMLLVQFVGLAARQRRASHQRQVALLEIANQAERVALLNWDDVATDKVTTWEPSAMLQAAIPQAERRIVVADEADKLATRRILLRLSWSGAAGQEIRPVELTVWKFRKEAQP